MSATPDLVTATDIESSIGDLFANHYAVVILDSDFTTFAEVEGACVVLFGYTPADAAALAMTVHTAGEAVAAVMGEHEARKATRSLRRWNVRSRLEKV
jgi:ATP-dependent Clp protease adapter protein ClpS